MSYEMYHHGIKGQKWGVRRYQNDDGTLTEAGKKRYAREELENRNKKKENQIKDLTPDPNRWVREDIQRRKGVVDANANLVKELKKVEAETRTTPTKTKMDLSKMTDKELRDRINRELLEQQYNKLFAKEPEQTVSKGRAAVQSALEIGGSVLAVTSSALGIALAIRELREG